MFCENIFLDKFPKLWFSHTVYEKKHFFKWYDELNFLNIFIYLFHISHSSAIMKEVRDEGWNFFHYNAKDPFFYIEMCRICDYLTGTGPLKYLSNLIHENFFFHSQWNFLWKLLILNKVFPNTISVGNGYSWF